MFNRKDWQMLKKPENSFTTKISEQIPSVFSVSTIPSFKTIENKHGIYRSKYCMKKFCKSLREHVVDIINFDKKKYEIINKGAAEII